MTVSIGQFQFVDWLKRVGLKWAELINVERVEGIMFTWADFATPDALTVAIQTVISHYDES